MKTKVIALIMLVLWAGTSCQQKIDASQQKMDAEKEREAIKDVIEGFLKAHAAYDYEGWISAWVNQPYVFLSYTDNDGYVVMKGREEIYKSAKQLFVSSKESDEKSGMSLSLEPHDYTLRVYPQSAWAQFKIKWTVANKGKTEKEEWETFENYSFEKVHEDWRIASISAVNTSSFDESQKGQEIIMEESSESGSR
jgi:hypothetical protein